MGSAGGVDFLVMEWVAGKTLEQLIARRSLTLADTLGYATQMAAGLTAAHQAGVVHRDFKPGKRDDHRQRHGQDPRFWARKAL